MSISKTQLLTDQLKHEAKANAAESLYDALTWVLMHIEHRIPLSFTDDEVDYVRSVIAKADAGLASDKCARPFNPGNTIFLCSRLWGHSGLHLAVDDKNEILAEWSDKA